MTTEKRPERLDNFLLKVKECISTGKYILTKHAFDRENECSINLTETLYVLKNGHEDKERRVVTKKRIYGNTLLEEHL